MTSRAWLSGLLLLLTLLAARAEIPEGYPASYAGMVRAADEEGRLVIYGATDAMAADPLIADFRALYPRIQVSYLDLSSTVLYQRFMTETQAGTATADVLWSSAMDLQVKLVNDGHAQAYASPERAKLPDWAVWKNEAYGTTLEPVGFAYNKRTLAAADVPRTHADFIRLLRSDPARFRGRVITYDLENSGLGFLFATQDAKASNMVWEIGQTLGQLQARQVDSTAAMLESIAAGDSLLGYNLLGSYTFDKVRTDPAIGFVFPRDYTLVGSRIMFIARQAAHPSAAKLWVDYILSKRGQTVLVNRSGLFSLRNDVRGPGTADALQQEVGSNLRPIAIGPSLMAYLDRSKRQEFLKRWKEALRAP